MADLIPFIIAIRFIIETARRTGISWKIIEGAEIASHLEMKLGMLERIRAGEKDVSGPSALPPRLSLIAA